MILWTGSLNPCAILNGVIVVKSYYGIKNIGANQWNSLAGKDLPKLIYIRGLRIGITMVGEYLSYYGDTLESRKLIDHYDQLVKKQLARTSRGLYKRHRRVWEPHRASGKVRTLKCRSSDYRRSNGVSRDRVWFSGRPVYRKEIR